MRTFSCFPRLLPLSGNTDTWSQIRRISWKTEFTPTPTFHKTWNPPLTDTYIFCRVRPLAQSVGSARQIYNLNLGVASSNPSPATYMCTFRREWLWNHFYSNYSFPTIDSMMGKYLHLSSWRLPQMKNNCLFTIVAGHFFAEGLMKIILLWLR